MSPQRFTLDDLSRAVDTLKRTLSKSGTDPEGSYGIDYIADWLKALLTAAPTPSVEDKTSSRPPVPDKPLYEIVKIETRVTESNDVWWRYAWRLTIRNVSPEAIVLAATIEFQDQNGFVVDTDEQYGLVVPARQTETFTGYKFVSVPAAATVAQVSAKTSIA